LPVSRSKHCVKSLWSSKAVRKTWRGVSTGEDLPGRTGVLHTMFLCLLNSVGKPVSVEIPEPFGPRKRVHSCAVPGKANRNNANRNGRRFIGILMTHR